MRIYLKVPEVAVEHPDNVRDLVGVQSHGLQVGVIVERLLLYDLDLVGGEVENLEAGQVDEAVRGQGRDPIIQYYIAM